MKFSLRSASNSGRLGIISHLNRLKEFEMETPHVLLHTSGGTVPHLTYDVLNMVSKEKLGLSIPIQSISGIQEQVKTFQHCIADYIGMTEYMTYCSHISPIEKKSNNTYVNGSVKLMTRNGNQSFSPESYMQLMEDIKPDMFLLLADGTINSKSGQKRIKKSFDNSLSLFEKCMSIFKSSSALRSSQVLAAIEGGSDLPKREQYSKLIGESSVFGIVFDGFHEYNETVADITSCDIKAAVEASLRHIPKDKLRIIHGCWNPSSILDLISLGIDLFDTSYVYFITEQSGAFIFPNTESHLEEYQYNSIYEEDAQKENSKKKQTVKANPEEPVSKKMRLAKNSKFYISLSDTCHTTDFTPINKNCTCLTCRNHTRAYVHHLVNVNEMLGQVLLMINRWISDVTIIEMLSKITEKKFGPELKENSAE